MTLAELTEVKLALTLMGVGEVLGIERASNETNADYRARLIAASDGRIADIKPGLVRLAGYVERVTCQLEWSQLSDHLRTIDERAKDQEKSR